ncbi:MAG: biopolymer transporter ExbD [Pseudomonadota bacterium]
MQSSPSAPSPLANRRRRRLRLSMTPLIDVVFILLVFFMLASSFLDWRSIRLSSTAAAGGATGAEGALLVELTQDGARLSGERLTMDGLIERVSARISQKPEQRILVRPATGVDMQRMVVLLDRLAASGAQDISLMAVR